MRVILFGASGMIGSGVLLECLADPRITAVLCVVRAPIEVTHAKLRSLVHDDFFDYSAIAADLADHDACFFCLGVSSGVTLPRHQLPAQRRRRRTGRSRCL